MGGRIKDVTGTQDYFVPELVFLVDKIDTGSSDWLQSRKMELSLLGNTYIQGSTNNVNWHDEITASDTYFRITTDGGTTWRSLNTDLIREGTTNKYYTEAKVSANAHVAANTAARHSHTNKSMLDNIIDNGTGENFLADDGVYKSLDTKLFALKTALINAQTGTSYTLLPTDNGKTITLNNTNPIYVTVPSGLTIGFNCSFIQIGEGAVTFLEDNTTINSVNNKKIIIKYGKVDIVSYATDTFLLSGDLTEDTWETTDLDISGWGLSSEDIDAYLIYHADTLGTNNTEMDIRGNSNPTSASADARQTLFDNFVLINYNEGFIP